MNQEAKQLRGAAMTRKKAVSVNTKTAGYTPTEREPAAIAPAVATSYAPTPAEKLAIARHQARVAARRKFPDLKATADGTGVVQIASDHKDETTALSLQLDALGLGSNHEFTSILKGVCNFTAKGGGVDAGSMTEAMALIVGMEPQNTMETMLAVQMAAVHLATMEAARRLNSTPGSFESITCHAKALNNLTRTFAAQTEAMKKLKGGGQQKVIVEHKHYYLAPGAIANSQAILGDVSQGGVTNEIERQPDERQASLPERTAVHGDFEANGVQVPSAGSDWLEGMPLSWSEGRGTERAS